MIWTLPIKGIILKGHNRLKWKRGIDLFPNPKGRSPRGLWTANAATPGYPSRHEKGASLSTLTNYDDIFEALGKNVETNLSFNEMLSIQNNYKSSLKNIKQYTLEGDNQKLDGVWYNIVPEDIKLEAQNRVKKHLGL